MHGEASAVTLLEDWQARRDRLARGPFPVGQYVASQIQILDYLIDRYRDTPEAAGPAGRPASSRLFVNDRAIVVNDHLWEGKVGGVKTPREAEQRVGAALKRMASGSGDEFLPTDSPRPPPGRLPPASARTLELWHPVFRAIRAGHNAHQHIERALSAHPVLPESVVQYLYERLVDPEWEDVWAAELLALCENESAVNYAVLAWRELHETGQVDDVVEVLRDFLRRPRIREQAVERVGLELANANAHVRLAAIELVGEIGGLKEVGLLSDLVSLMPLDDEDPGERDALIRAMRSISRKEGQD